ncbi:MAG TPA: amino acid adenylation domain-containing protein, partial [Puia sp.]|nr:amino acid adenylation domain-containing protein [Puia sp.]
MYEGQKLSYQALEERTNQLAHYLIERGITRGDLVPMLMERGIEMVIGMLGIQKAGGAYVPMDTDFPQDRIAYMVEDTKAKLVLSSSESSGKLNGIRNIEILELDEARSELRIQPTTPPQAGLKAADTAYVIYTSGSTGKPKGVSISHRNLTDYVYGLEDKIRISESKSFALVSSIATDLGNTVLYGSLLTGGALHVLGKETVSQAADIHEYFERNGIDCVKIVPGHWQALSMGDKPLLPNKLLIFGGEALQPKQVAQIKAAGTTARIVNHYGPTETTIGKLLHEVDKENPYTNGIPIGKPFSNTRVYVISKDNRLCPIGVPGQLYIAGDGVSEKGYLNQPQLTAEKFIQNPYSKNKGEKMYGTGDRVVQDTEGNITFIGRVDDQVKIRGYRVEPGEAGRVLQESNLVAQAIVLATDDKQGNKQLTAYIIPNGNSKEAIYHYLKAHLPDYMVPSQVMELERFPMTANGKIDRKALPDPEGAQTAASYQAPQTETEEKLTQIWQEILEIEKVGTTDDFFAIGGHSLLAVRLVSAIRKQFGAELAIAEVFDYPTVGQLSRRIEEKQSTGEQASGITAVTPRPTHIPLSFSQER